MVESDKRGLQVVYRLGAPEVFHLWRTLRDLGTARLAEVDRLVETYIADRASLEAVDINQLRALLAEGGVTLLDVRPALEYRQGHIPGAQSVPVDELERRLSELSRDREVVAYCRGPYCVSSAEPAKVLHPHRFTSPPLQHALPNCPTP